MNKNFLFLNFCTEYSSEGDTNKDFDQEACFSTIFYSEGNGIVQNNRYTIKLYKLGDLLNKEKQNNAVLTDRAGIVSHLKVLQSVFKFRYSIIDNKDHYIINLSLNADLIYHKYLLTWVRYLYEYPFNVFLVDAYRCKKIPEFKFESVINLFNLIGATSGICQHGTDIHAIGATHKFKERLTTKQIQKALKELCGGRKMINSIFNYFTNADIRTINKDRDSLHSSDYWESEREFTERLTLYKHNYKILTTNKK